MGQSIRQNNLFASEDFSKIYKSFKDVDFRAYDFDTLKTALVDYVRIHFPEDFNDYIESSEFIAIIELLAYLGQSLSFRVDLNTRENFLDTAERRESIIRLARMINYQPKRNLAASGLFKLAAVQTTQPLTDSLGRQLNNRTIYWNDANNVDSFEQFTQILNAAFIKTNPFGKSYKSGTIGNIPTQLYQLNNIKGIEVAYPFSVNINGDSLPFEIVNPDFEDNEYIFEQHPDPDNAFNMIYRNDSQGLGSANTGFFLFFKQGTLSNVDFRFDFPIQNRVEEINIENINETDVFVQEINDQGNVQAKWTKVPSLVGNNVIFNSVELNVRDIFTVIPGLNDTVSLRFADGNFGEVPSGIFRAWVRSSVGRRFDLRPDDVQNFNIVIPYVGTDGQEYDLRLTFSLEQTVSNSAPAESDADIKERAPQVFYTQNRMVNNEDYNVFPLTRGNEIERIRAINRTHAGHSRFIDINDPTGTHQNVIMFAEDGVIYKDDEPSRLLINLSSSSVNKTLVENQLEDFIKNNQQLRNFFYDVYYKQFVANTNVFDLSSLNLTWNTRPAKVKNDTGYFFDGVSAINVQFSQYQYIRPGAKIKFMNPVNATDQIVVVVKSIVNFGLPINTAITTIGPIELSAEVPNNWKAVSVIPAFRTELTEQEVLNIVAEMDLINPFGIGYDLDLDKWYVITGDNLKNDAFSLTNQHSMSSTNNDASWLLYATYNFASDGQSASYEFVVRGTRYIFESEKEIRFFNSNEENAYDLQTGRSLEDEIEITDLNKKPGVTEVWTYQSSSWTNGTLSYSTDTIVLRSRDITSNDALVTSTALGFISSQDINAGLLFTGNITPVDGDTITIVYDAADTLDTPLKWNIIKSFIYEDGYSDPRKVEIAPVDSNHDDVPDEPFSFDMFVNPTDRVFFEKIIDFDNYEYTVPWITGHIDATGVLVINSSLLELNGQSLSIGDLIIVDDQTKLTTLVNSVNSLVSPNKELYVDAIKNKIVFIKSTEKFKLLLEVTGNIVSNNDQSHEVRNGRSFTLDTTQVYEPLIFKWRHYAPRNNRIDPSISNIIDLFIVTSTYLRDVILWRDERKSINEFPTIPTTEELRVQFGELEKFKMLSDQLIFRPGKFKLLFGNGAATELLAKFKIVKVPSTLMTDNEIKAKVVAAIDSFFDIANWDFGESFYYTELATYIHQQLANVIGTIVIVPTKEESKFGNLFQVKSEPTELFLSTAAVTDIEIVNNLTETNLRIK